MRHTTEIKLANLKDIILAETGIIKSDEIRQLTVENAIVDTGATRLSLPKPLIEQLGLEPVGNARARRQMALSTERFILRSDLQSWNGAEQ